MTDGQPDDNDSSVEVSSTHNMTIQILNIMLVVVAVVYKIIISIVICIYNAN